jgi:ATP-dependent Clp protease ATP-binding subunit ClpB
MRLDRLTVKSRDALAAAESMARREGHQEVTGLHMLMALLDQEGGLVTPLLEKAGIDVRLLRGEVERALEQRPKVQGSDTYLGRDLKEILDGAFGQADQL